jgi:hypothetical protein
MSAVKTTNPSLVREEVTEHKYTPALIYAPRQEVTEAPMILGGRQEKSDLQPHAEKGSAWRETSKGSLPGFVLVMMITAAALLVF